MDVQNIFAPPTPTPTCIGGEVPAVAAAVAVLRERLRGFALGHGFDHDQAGLVALATTEAATNVVQHAYEDGDDTVIEFAADFEDGDLQVVIGDRGRGLRECPEKGGLGLGLQTIATAVADFSITDRDPRGLEVWMRFVGEAPDRS